MALCIGFFSYFFLHIFIAITPIASSHANGECNLFEGSWVLNDSYPLYDSKRCPFVAEGWNCQMRPDKTYLKYKWKPNGCDLPRFNGISFLEKFRGKRIRFVGDSIGNNQYQSLICLLHNAAPKLNYNSTSTEMFSTFEIPEYALTIEKITNHFLVDLITKKTGRILQLDSLTSANQWLGADVLIFNSYHWWLHSGKLQTWDYFQVGNMVSEDMDRMEAYKIGMTTWAKWVDANIDPCKTRVFFQGISAVHVHGNGWGEQKAKSCKHMTTPIPGSAFPGAHYPGEHVLKDVLGSMKKPVTLIDITLMTQLRKDSHPGVYAGRGLLDCSHFCLAGVPDSWNELLYALLTQNVIVKSDSTSRYL